MGGAGRSARLDLRLSEVNRKALAICLLPAIIWLLAVAAEPGLGLGPSLPVDPDRAARAAERIDPNTAPVRSLIRLPGLGPERSKAIVEYRNRPDTPPFTRATDLDDVPGIGEGTIRSIQPFLQMDAEARP
jgi:DNA uptake protein ComE-like DNA-binding protein